MAGYYPGQQIELGGIEKKPRGIYRYTVTIVVEMYKSRQICSMAKY